jgi:hypothetical protein
MLALSIPLAPADFAPEGLEGDGLREGMLLAHLRQQAAASEAEPGRIMRRDIWTAGFIIKVISQSRQCNYCIWLIRFTSLAVRSFLQVLQMGQYDEFEEEQMIQAIWTVNSHRIHELPCMLYLCKAGPGLLRKGGMKQACRFISAIVAKLLLFVLFVYIGRSYAENVVAQSSCV